MLFRDVLCDGCDELLGGKDLEVVLILPMSHAGPIENLAGIFDMGDFVFREGVHHDHPRNAIIEAQHRAEEDLEAFLGTVAQLRQELAVVLEIDAQQDRDTEDELSIRDAIEVGVGDVFPELNRF
jgi:hypothetical protein